VIQRLSPEAVAIRPSSEVASFRVIIADHNPCHPGKTRQRLVRDP
jgi:hypothetical protein